MPHQCHTVRHQRVMHVKSNVLTVAFPATAAGDGALQREVLRVLQKLPEERSTSELRLVLALFCDTTFFRALHYRLLCLLCCRHMTLHSPQPGGVVYGRGDTVSPGSRMYIVIAGAVVEDDARGGEAVRFKAGESFGEGAVRGHTQRGTRALADDGRFGPSFALSTLEYPLYG